MTRAMIGGPEDPSTRTDYRRARCGEIVSNQGSSRCCGGLRSAKSPRENEKRWKTPRANTTHKPCSEARFLSSPRWSKLPDLDWQSRGQGFKSPQLHFWNPQQLPEILKSFEGSRECRLRKLPFGQESAKNPREHSPRESAGIRLCKRCAAPVNARPGGIAASDARPARASREEVLSGAERPSPLRNAGSPRRTRNTSADVAAGGPGHNRRSVR